MNQILCWYSPNLPEKNTLRELRNWKRRRSMILSSPFCKSVARRQHLLWRQEREQRIRVSVCMQAHTSLSPPKHCGQKFRTGGCCYVVKLRFCMYVTYWPNFTREFTRGRYFSINSSPYFKLLVFSKCSSHQMSQCSFEGKLDRAIKWPRDPDPWRCASSAWYKAGRAVQKKVATQLCATWYDHGIYGLKRHALLRVRFTKITMYTMHACWPNLYSLHIIRMKKSCPT